MDIVKKLVFILSVILFLSACTRSAPEETQLSLEFKVGRNINPDDKARPSPLVITLFELKTPDSFQQADFFSLYEHPAEQLSADLLSKRKLRELVPGIDRTDNLNLNQNAKYIGILAEFVQYQHAKARLVVPIKQKDLNHILIELSGTELKWQPDIKKEKDELQPVQM